MDHDSTKLNSKPKSRKKRILPVLVCLLAILAAFVLVLPTLLGSKWIYEPLLKRLAKDQFELTIDSVRLRWFSPLEFEGISVRQGNDAMANTQPPLATIRSIKSNRGLLGYLLNGRNLGKIEILQPRLDITLLEDGTNLERLIKAIDDSKQGESKPKSKSQPNLDIDLAIRGLSVQLEPPDGRNPFEIIPPMNADISYRAIDQSPHLVIQPTQILDQAQLTPELVQLGLGLAVPLLAKSAWFDGKVSLETKEIVVPLLEPIKSSGEATLTLHEVRSGPSEPLIVGALDALANLRGKEPNHELVFVDGSHVIVKMADERIFHSGLEAGLPRLDSRLQVATEGSVGLADRSLDLRLEIPVPIEQIARREAIQKMGVPRIKLPIGGTLDHPEVQWDVMRGESATLLSVIAGRLQSEAPITSTVVDTIGNVTEGQADEAIAAAVDFVKALRERRNQNKTNSDSRDNNTKDEQSAEPERRRPLRDALRKVLKGE